MKPSRALLFGAIATLLLVLAACSGGSEGANRPQPDTVTVSLGIESGDLSALGVPFEAETGNPAVETVRIWIYDSADEALKFELDGDTYVASTTGSIGLITLSGAALSSNVELPLARNPYRFVALAYDSGTGASIGPLPSAIAFGSKTQNVFDNTSVAIKLASILASDPSAAVLLPRLPLTAPAPDMTIDFMLSVYSRHNGDGPYLVPLEDFELVDDGSSYSVTNGTIVSQSKRGVRVEVGDECTAGSQLTIAVTVSGLIAANSDGTSDTGERTANLDLDCFDADAHTTTGSRVFTDIEPPEVTIVDYDVSSGALPTEISGTATDNLGIRKVQLYDGPFLVASTDDSDGVPSIEFSDTADPTAYSVTFSPSNPSSGSLVAYAWDYWGNQATSHETVNPNYLYVDSCSDYAVGVGDGSIVFPFRSIHEAVAIVWENGTINVAANDGCGGEVLSEPVVGEKHSGSIIGAGHDRSASELQDTDLATSRFINGGFEIAANDVSISGLHFSVSGTPAGFPDTVTTPANNTRNVYIWITEDDSEQGNNLVAISSNVFVGNGPATSNLTIRAIVNGTLDSLQSPGSPADVTALIEHNLFTELTTGIFAWKGADFTIRHNRFVGNRTGSANMGNMSRLVDNVFSGNLEGISLEVAPENVPEILSNCFAQLSGTSVHIRSYVDPFESALLDQYIMDNDFAVGSAQIAGITLIDFEDGTPSTCG